ncbi:MAG: 3-oxoacyl-ACP synthase, partial [Nitrospirae bacterium]|nr:3-oxoacyl-ACP synthase [Nitrospirota bacterium]
YSKYIHPQDKSVKTIFSDGAAATLITSINDDSITDPIGDFIFGTDGKGAKNLIVPAGGMRLPKSKETKSESTDSSGNIRSKENLYMDGGEIFNFTLNTIPSAVNQLLTRSNLDINDIDYFIFHQANKFMLEALRKNLKIPTEKFCINMEGYGNTVSSSIPMAMEIALNQGTIFEGSRVMLVGFGVGYSWAATIVTI